MIDLVTLVQAKAHLNQDGTHKDTEIALKITSASAAVMTYIKASEPLEVWRLGTSPETYEFPADIIAATLLVLGDMFENREASTANPISPAVEALLSHYRDPSFA